MEPLCCVLHIGSTVSHYRIVEKLGEGGMGVVYKAEDMMLEPAIALKFLAEHLLNEDEAKQRFPLEAKAAAALRHSNTCRSMRSPKTEARHSSRWPAATDACFTQTGILLRSGGQATRPTPAP